MQNNKVGSGMEGIEIDHYDGEFYFYGNKKLFVCNDKFYELQMDISIFH
jgi:hypothetical protein